MGLDTTHGCWNGGYCSFNVWRMRLAETAGIPLALMEGFSQSYSEIPSQAMEWLASREGGPLCGSHYGPLIHGRLEEIQRFIPIRWDVLKPDPLIVLLDHSDYDGCIEPEDCGPLANRLEELLPLLPEAEGRWDWRALTQTFIDGLRLAAQWRERVEFH